MSRRPRPARYEQHHARDTWDLGHGDGRGSDDLSDELSEVVRKHALRPLSRFGVITAINKLRATVLEQWRIEDRIAPDGDDVNSTDGLADGV